MEYCSIRKRHGSLEGAVSFLFCLGFLFFLGMLFHFRRIARYNREVYPHLHSDWAHTFMCRRCGKYSLIRYSAGSRSLCEFSSNAQRGNGIDNSSNAQ